MPPITPQAFSLTILIVLIITLWRPVVAFSPFKHLNLSHVLAIVCGALLPSFLRRLAVRSIRANHDDRSIESSIYGLDHGRLHLKLPHSMWMNMGYWKTEEYTSDPDIDTESHVPPMTLAEACPNLLVEIFKTAGINRKRASSERQCGIKKRMCVIDLGFGCGDQTACLMGTIAPRRHQPSGSEPSDFLYTGEFGHAFEDYVGITLDEKQYRYAVERVQPSSPVLGRNPRHSRVETHNVKIDMFCADAAKPGLWDAKIKACLQEAVERSQVRWVLALDTAYHFSPSRWPVIKHACQILNASFAAFDLCLSPTASLRQRLVLRLLTTLMGAPWANFVTPEQYRAKLIEAGYDASGIIIRDISEDVFDPLSEFLARQDRELRVIGLGLGPLNVARLMFSWWARSGVVRGVIMVAKQKGQ